MEGDVLKFIFEYLKGLRLPKCDVYLSRPTIVGEKEKRNNAYVIAAFPNGFTNMNAYAEAVGVITIGAKDKIIGLPFTGGITEISDKIKKAFPIITKEYSFIDFEFSSDDSQGNGWHEYYYTFRLYINGSN